MHVIRLRFGGAAIRSIDNDEVVVRPGSPWNAEPRLLSRV